MNLLFNLSFLYFSPHGSLFRAKKVPQCPILPGSCPPSTFGAGRLYCCVRYGNRCGPSAIITGSFSFFSGDCKSTETNRSEGALAVRPAKWPIFCLKNNPYYHHYFSNKKSSLSLLAIIISLFNGWYFLIILFLFLADKNA